MWIGRRAVQAVLAFLDGRAGPTVLLDALSGHVTAWEESDHEAPADETPADHETPAGHRAATDRRAVAMTTQRAVRAVHGGIARTGPAWLGRLAPAVETAAAEGTRRPWRSCGRRPTGSSPPRSRSARARGRWCWRVLC
nr:hypothetical protein GCM10020093_014510 [Planobispora longispora]